MAAAVTRPVRLGLVGCGRLAEAGYVPAATLVPEVRVAAVADPDSERREQVAAALARFGAAVDRFATVEELLDRADVDGLVLATPVGAHVGGAAAATAAGLPVLVEKPPAPDAAGAAALERLDPPPWIGFNRRFDPGVLALRARVPADGPLELRLQLHYRRRSWRPHAVRDDVLLDLGPHVVDLARWLTGSDVVEVASASSGPERARFDLVLRRGRASIDLAADRAHREVVEVRAPGGRTIARHRLGGPIALVRGRLPFGSAPPALVVSLAAQLAAFADAVDGRSPTGLATAADGRAAMQVIDAVRATASAGARSSPVSSDR
jgi:predicted dehydrogenase